MTRLALISVYSGYGTNLEGLFPVVCKAIERCHEAVHKMGALRIATDVRIGTRTDKPPPVPTSQSEGQAEKKSNDAEDWAAGLTENERKKQSVLRRLEQDRLEGNPKA